MQKLMEMATKEQLEIVTKTVGRRGGWARSFSAAAPVALKIGSDMFVGKLLSLFPSTSAAVSAMLFACPNK